MSEFITVFTSRNSSLLIDSDVAEEFGISNGHYIETDREFWTLVRAHAAMSIAKLKIEQIMKS